MNNFKFLIDERRRQVASLIALSMTETEIAEKLSVAQSTIARDIQALKEMSQSFIYDLAKSDLAYYYKQCIDGIEEAQKHAWRVHNKEDITAKDKLLALKIIIDSNVEKFGLFERGPSMMCIRSLEEKLIQIESRQASR